MKSNRLKDIIKSKNSRISFEEYRIRYATERFLARLQESKYKDNFVIKGGFLLGAIFKVEDRTTKDLDTVLKGISAEKENINKTLKEIANIELDDGVKFELIDLLESQQEHVYEGFRAKFKMVFVDENSMIQFDLDIGVGDIITPAAEVMEIPLLFNEKKGKNEALTLYTYPLETVLAEKTEIILSLGSKNSRMKDFYDVYLILNYQDKPSINKFYKAFENTWIFRHNGQKIDEELFEDWFFAVDELSANKQMSEKYWKNYIKDREYANNLKFVNILHQFENYLMDLHQVYKDK